MEILCERCRERGARIFSTRVNGRPEETTQRNLCFACHDIEHPGERKDMEKRRCRYCGWKDENGFCQPCMREFRRFLRSRGLDFPASQWTPEQFAQAGAIFMELEQHMKRWGAERRRKES